MEIECEEEHKNDYIRESKKVYFDRLLPQKLDGDVNGVTYKNGYYVIQTGGAGCLAGFEVEQVSHQGEEYIVIGNNVYRDGDVVDKGPRVEARLMKKENRYVLTNLKWEYE